MVKTYYRRQKQHLPNVVKISIRAICILFNIFFFPFFFCYVTCIQQKINLIAIAKKRLFFRSLVCKFEDSKSYSHLRRPMIEN